MTRIFLLFFYFYFIINSYTQDSIKIEKIEEIIVESQRIDLPFSENAHSIVLINSKDIENSNATNVADVLQQVAGVDIRRKGIEGMQSDINIRGGSFDQVLILIDGIKTDDAQTGHHSMNIMIPIENIERIEIIKGPSARIYGQNAFTGVINIVTKQKLKSNLILKAGLGSFNTFNAEITGVIDTKPVSFQAHYSRIESDGYRYNTDFKSDNFFLKANIKTKKNTISFLGIFNNRKFGANGFYASPKFIDQYEEIQTSLIGISTKYKINKLTLKPKIYWKRNQDNYFFLRQNPSFFENFHISNKIVAELNSKYVSKIGISGFGIDLTQTYLSSNNLGERKRISSNIFLEHRFLLFQNKLSIIPGIALSYYSDFKFHTFPGLDIGFKINDKLNIFGNIGYTYRIPTYTDLYYSSPSTLGNSDLKPETALSKELGLIYKENSFVFSVTAFNRDSKNLIDYTKEKEKDKYKANNIRAVSTSGIEMNTSYNFKLFKQNQNLKLAYTFITDNIKGLDVPFSRYTLNTAKHHFTGNVDFSFMKDVRHFLSYKFIERIDGNSYNIIDAKISFEIKQVELSGVINNILNTKYYETNLVPMPERNFMFSIKYSLK